MTSAGEVNIIEILRNFIFMVYWSNCNTKK